MSFQLPKYINSNSSQSFKSASNAALESRVTQAASARGAAEAGGNAAGGKEAGGPTDGVLEGVGIINEVSSGEEEAAEAIHAGFEGIDRE